MGVIQFKKGGSIQFKGGTGTIQFKNLGKVANPTVNAYYLKSSTSYWKAVDVINHDTETVTAHVSNSSSPATSMVTVAGGATKTIVLDYIDYQLDDQESFTVYVQMTAEGRLDSDIISDEYISPNKVASPTVEAKWGGSFGAWTQLVTVTNNDVDTVSVYASKSSTPSTLQGSLNPGDSSTYIVAGPYSVEPSAGQTFTAYVRLKRDGRPDSDIISHTGVYQRLF